MRTPQELFDECVVKLHAQGRPAWSTEKESCVYQDPHGNRCAVGHLLVDTEGVSGFNDGALGDVPLCALPERDRERQLLLALQAAHDYDVYSSDKWWSSFVCQARAAAAKFNLSTAALDAREALKRHDQASGK